MPSDNDDPKVAVIMEMLIKHDAILQSLASAIDTTSETLASLTALSKDHGHDPNPPRRQPDSHDHEPTWERHDHLRHPDRTPEQAAVLLHYDQLRSSLGRRTSKFYVGVLRLDEDVLALLGENARRATRIRVGAIDTPASDWQGDGPLLVCRRTDFGAVDDGSPVECYGEDGLIGVGVWTELVEPYRLNAMI